MDYREFQPPEALAHLVKLGWTLEVPGSAGEWQAHDATPDGCMEIIRRLSGRSAWRTEQPDRFVAGLVTRPAALRLDGGSRFVGLRLWPWTWTAIGGGSPAALTDRWAAFTDSTFPATPDEGFDWLAAKLVAPPPRSLIAAILAARTCREMAATTGLSPRALQRWFDRNVGQPPRAWLRLMRFSEAFAGLEGAQGLAGHALDHGFADQAHMAREFRFLAGTPASQARRRGHGPFIADPHDGG